MMTGKVITKKNKSFLFTTNSYHGHDSKIWAWDMYNDGGFTGRTPLHKWDNFPKGSTVIWFDIDNPPKTVGFIPTLSS